MELDTETSPFIVEADDSYATKWMVGLSSGALREHVGLLALANTSTSGLGRRASLRLCHGHPLSHGLPDERAVRAHGADRFKWHTGHVTIGGSLCTELLTPSGWISMTV